MKNATFELAAVVFLIVINGLLAMSEMAIVSLRTAGWRVLGGNPKQADSMEGSFLQT